MVKSFEAVRILVKREKNRVMENRVGEDLEHNPELVNLVSAAKRSHKGSKIGGAAKTPKDIVFDESSVS